MNNTISNTLHLNLQKKTANHEKIFIPYIMGGYPDYATTLKIMFAIEKAGADAIELGMPFTDPVADGPVILEAGIKALNAGASVQKHLDLIAEFRKLGGKIPLIWMGYYNPIYKYQLPEFTNKARELDINALVIPDLPIEEASTLKQLCLQKNLSLINFITVNTSKQRIYKIIQQSESGFIYLVTIAGITGSHEAKLDIIKNSYNNLRNTGITLPIIAGFGIKTPQQAKEINQICNGVIVGSELISHINTHINNPNIAKICFEFCASFTKIT